MKKVFFLLLLCLIILTAASAADKPIITVLDFSADGVSESEMRSIINFLSSSLFKTGKFTVIDVSQRENILNELEFSMSGCTDESCYLEVGKMLSAEGIVVGSIGRVGSRFLLTAKLLQTETGATKSSADGMYKNLDELLDDIQNIAAGLTDQTQSAVQVAEPVKSEQTESGAETAADTAEAEADAAAIEIEAELQAEAAEPLDINFPAWGSLAGAVGCLGAGGYFLAVSLPLFIDYTSARKAYDAATEASSAESLYAEAEAARTAAVDGNVNLYLPLGAGLAAAGVGLGVLSTILFLADGDDSGIKPPVQAAMLPVPGGVQLSFLIHPQEKY